MGDELDPWTWIERALEAGEAGDYEGALVAAGRAIELDPDNPVAWLDRGVALWHLGRAAEAAVQYRRAAELDPSQAHVWAYLGDALEQIGERDDATAAYDQACAHGWARYRVDIRGENYLTKSGRLGFLTTRFVVAESEAQAMERAVQTIRDDPRLQVLDDKARMVIEGVSEGWDEYEGGTRTGYAFFAEDEPEARGLGRVFRRR